MNDVTRIVYIVYIVAMVVVWTAVVWDDWHKWVLDARDNAEDLFSDLAMLISSVAGAATLVAILVGVGDRGVRGALFGLFLGGFLAAGITRLTLRRHQTSRSRRGR